jgi:transposase/ribosomal protein S15P/S13E
MARYKRVDSSPRLLPVDLAAQLVPGTFEHALDHLLDAELDLSSFDARYRNDTSGASAYEPRVLLKAILFGYSRGLVSSRAIERACRENVVFIALTRDAAPHFTTMAGFLSQSSEQIPALFAQVLYLCDRQGLIGREMFAIDGVKLPSNASKAKSGTRADFLREAARLERAVQKMLVQHRDNDRRSTAAVSAAERKVERLTHEASELRRWLSEHPHDRQGSRGGVRKSNRTDCDSAKMATSKGVIQGFTGVAAVDARHQIIVEAQAHGSGSEQELLLPVVKAMSPWLAPHSCVSADAGYHSEVNLKALERDRIEALIADNSMRARDERFADRARHKALPDPLHDKSATLPPSSVFGVEAFKHDPVAKTCICPAGKSLYRNGSHIVTRGYAGVKFRGAKRDCGPCALREQCLRKPHSSATRQVVFFAGKDPKTPESATERMKRRIDSPEGRTRYARRLAIVEPVFANLRYNKRLDRFTLRGRRKVDTQWKLYCLVHNLEKLAKHRSLH